MASGISAIVKEDPEGEKDPTECAICLQPYVFPAELPCGHVFCFLCIKGTANQSKRCAMCRQEIPHDFMENPNILKNKVEHLADTFEGCYQWFYEGRNGWWQYDERTSKELEVAYKAGERTCELLIAGFLYVMDFDAMLQLRRNDPSRRRRMKRDLVTIEKKGVAGLRSNNQIPLENFEPTAESTVPINLREPEGVADLYCTALLEDSSEIVCVDSDSDGTELDVDGTELDVDGDYDGELEGRLSDLNLNNDR